MSLSSLTASVSSFLQSSLRGVGGSDPAASSSAPHKSISKSIAIKELYVHPVKSCRGISVQQSAYTETGLLYDRLWLIVLSDSKKFCTARELPAMVTIIPRIDEAANELSLEVPLPRGSVTVRTPLTPSDEFLRGCKIVNGIHIWADKDQEGYAVSSEADKVLSEFFGKDVVLVRKGPKARKSGPPEEDVLASIKGSGVDMQWKESNVNFQDFYPVLLTSRASMRHLNRSILASVYPSMSVEEDEPEEVKVTRHRVPDAVNREYWTPEQIETMEIRRFRPNIVVDAIDGDRLEGFEEDEWQHVEIFPAGSDASSAPPLGPEAEGRGRGIYCMNRCLRCQVPCIDTDSGVRDAYLPSRVLQAYRRVEPSNKYKPAFGMLCTPRETAGTLHVGDIVRVTRTAKRPVLDQTSLGPAE